MLHVPLLGAEAMVALEREITNVISPNLERLVVKELPPTEAEHQQGKSYTESTTKNGETGYAELGYLGAPES